MNKISKQLIECFRRGNKVLICGNGGSATMSSHFACEFVCSFENKARRPLAAISLTDNPAIMTAWPNDFNFKYVFLRQVAALVMPGDVVIGISTSGKSKNILEVKKFCRLIHDHHVLFIDFPRKGKDTASIQEFQLKYMHRVCREVEKTMFP